VRLRGDRSTFPPRHCSPIDGNLCLLGRESRQWRHQWTLRKLLELQLADALHDEGEEDEQGEPAEYWWNHLGQQGSYCLVDSSWNLREATDGTLTLRYRLLRQDGHLEIHAVVTEVSDSAGLRIHDWSAPVPRSLSEGAKETRIPWLYVDETIFPTGDILEIQELMDSLKAMPRLVEYGTSVTARWFAISYRSELGFRTEGLSWLFPFVFGSKKSFRKPKPGEKRKAPRAIIVPTFRAGEDDLGARVPAVRLLRDKKVAVVGLGAVGAPLAVELARNGCSLLHLVDLDRVEPGNSIRWPLGASAWGREKADSLSELIQNEYPWTEAVAHYHAVGTFANDNAEAGDDALFETILRDIDLVVDGTASYGVSTILSDHCRDLGIPLIALYASPPVEGGIVARFSPESGCPTCLEFAYHAGMLQHAAGFGEERGLQQPPGCSERTFTGASFDLQELSLQAMRLIVQTVQDPSSASLSEIQTLSFVSDGRRVPPVWRVNALPKFDDCSCSVRT
jgi:hypothetical protein